MEVEGPELTVSQGVEVEGKDYAVGWDEEGEGAAGEDVFLEVRRHDVGFAALETVDLSIDASLLTAGRSSIVREKIMGLIGSHKKVSRPTGLAGAPRAPADLTPVAGPTIVTSTATDSVSPNWATDFSLLEEIKDVDPIPGFERKTHNVTSLGLRQTSNYHGRDRITLIK
ncbi:hypothetical protein ACLOJK_012777 [Asimina triloba]